MDVSLSNLSSAAMGYRSYTWWPSSRRSPASGSSRRSVRCGDCRSATTSSSATPRSSAGSARLKQASREPSSASRRQDDREPRARRPRASGPRRPLEPRPRRPGTPRPRSSPATSSTLLTVAGNTSRQSGVAAVALSRLLVSVRAVTGPICAVFENAGLEPHDFSAADARGYQGQKPVRHRRRHPRERGRDRGPELTFLDQRLLNRSLHRVACHNNGVIQPVVGQLFVAFNAGVGE